MQFAGCWQITYGHAVDCQQPARAQLHGKSSQDSLNPQGFRQKTDSAVNDVFFHRRKMDFINPDDWRIGCLTSR